MTTKQLKHALSVITLFGICAAIGYFTFMGAVRLVQIKPTPAIAPTPITNIYVLSPDDFSTALKVKSGTLPGFQKLVKK